MTTRSRRARAGNSKLTETLAELDSLRDARAGKSVLKNFEVSCQNVVFALPLSLLLPTSQRAPALSVHHRFEQLFPQLALSIATHQVNEVDDVYDEITEDDYRSLVERRRKHNAFVDDDGAYFPVLRANFKA